jgi:hypothetical protein
MPGDRTPQRTPGKPTRHSALAGMPLVPTPRCKCAASRPAPCAPQDQIKGRTIVLIDVFIGWTHRVRLTLKLRRIRALRFAMAQEQRLHRFHMEQLETELDALEGRT